VRYMRRLVEIRLNAKRSAAGSPEAERCDAN